MTPEERRAFGIGVLSSATATVLLMLLFRRRRVM